MKRVETGTYKTFFDAIVNVEKKNGNHIFTYNSYAERFTMLRYILNRSNIIKIYSFDITMLSKNSKSKLIQEIKNDSSVIYNFLYREFKDFFSKQNSLLEILLDKEESNFMNLISDDIENLFQDKLNTGRIIIKQIEDDINLVKGLNHFIVVPELSLVCFDQGRDNLQICSIKEENIVNSTNVVFDNLFKISSPIPVESNICDE